MSIDIATITCPSCGADADSVCFYPGVAFCMECGDVFSLTENGEVFATKIMKNKSVKLKTGNYEKENQQVDGQEEHDVLSHRR